MTNATTTSPGSPGSPGPESFSPETPGPQSPDVRPPGARQPRTVIELTDVTKIYRMGDNEVRALNGVSIAFKEGEFWSILGTSGSGKSTMLNLLGCLDRPTSGRYVLDGQDVSKLNDDKLSAVRLKRLGFIFQSFNLIPQLTVLENIQMPLFYQGQTNKQAAERATELAAMVGLGERTGHRPTELSGGQQQRVAIARALAGNPSLLLADEPTGNLDTATGDQIMAMIQGLHQEGKTIIMVTHEPEIAAFSQHQLVMKDGKIHRIVKDGVEVFAQ